MSVKTHTPASETPWIGRDFPNNAVSARLASDQIDSGAMVKLSSDRVASSRVSNASGATVDYTLFLTYTEFPT